MLPEQFLVESVFAKVRYTGSIVLVEMLKMKEEIEPSKTRYQRTQKNNWPLYTKGNSLIVIPCQSEHVNWFCFWCKVYLLHGRTSLFHPTGFPFGLGDFWLFLFDFCTYAYHFFHLPLLTLLIVSAAAVEKTSILLHSG